jgi:hypothetical protein
MTGARRAGRARLRAAVAAWCACLGWAASAGAQPAPAPDGGPRRFEVGVGWLWTGESDLGTRSATLTPNLGGAPVVLFESSATSAAPLGGQLRVSYRVARWLLVGVTGDMARGDVTVRISGDFEGAPAATFTGEPLGQASVSARVDVLMPRLRGWGLRVTPHVAATAGVMRQWHDGQVLIEHGQIYSGGAGVRVARLGKAGATPSRFGLLAEVRVTAVHGGFHWGETSRTAPTAVVECFAGWGR